MLDLLLNNYFEVKLMLDFFNSIELYSSRSDSIDAYLQKVVLFDSLMTIGYELSKNDLVFQILEGLPINYENIIISLSSQEPLSSFFQL